jgi:malate dehydrogenase (oxaloacetate-decarboxylating)(NADP+)
MEKKYSREHSAMDLEALRMHAAYPPGKVALAPTKPVTTQYQLSLAYSPGVAAPCLEIADNEDAAYDYTAKGNTVAVISNGSAVLGLGDLGGLGSKPVMEGKAVLFKRFADIDGVDIELDTYDPEEIIQCVKLMSKTWGGINLEDIKAPDCFIIEQRLREICDVPVFHDDQHGTAIIAAAGLVNALQMTDRKLEDVKIVVNGAGAAAISCVELIKRFGAKNENVTLCDSRGAIYKGREDGMNQWKSGHAVETDARSLADAVNGADVFLGVSVRDSLTPEMLKSMGPNPVVFALANPNPEIDPKLAMETRDDVIIATGRSDYPNQVNNVLGFPYLFRGALDVRARAINDEMKLAAAEALAELAREDVPDEVAEAYQGRRLAFGPEYIIPTPFDPRLITAIPIAVAKAAVATGVARKPIEDWDAYERELAARLDPTLASMSRVFSAVKSAPKRVVFAEGEEERTIRAAIAFKDQGLGTPILIGREDTVRAAMKAAGREDPDIEVHNAAVSSHNPAYTEYLYNRMRRKGMLERDCQRLVNQNRNTFAACMVANGDADAMVTGLTRSFSVCFEEVTNVLGVKDGDIAMGLTTVIARDRTVLMADTHVHEVPTPEEMADIACTAAKAAKRMGYEPRVALLSYSNFGNPGWPSGQRVREAVEILDGRNVDFEYEGDMTVDVAMSNDIRERLYPFARLTGPANVLVMPALQSGNISAKLLRYLGGASVIGPSLLGLEKSAQIVPMGATVSEVVNLAALAAHAAID